MSSPGDETLQQFEWLNTPFRLRFRIDFEKERTLRLVYSKDDGSPEVPVLVVPSIQTYIDHRANFFSLQANLGRRSTFVVNLVSLHVYERKRKLEITDYLSISSHLSEEIFQKVQAYTASLQQDQKSLKSIFDGYSGVLNRASELQAMVVDFFRGSRRMEETVLESISKLSSLNPDNLPKMIRIKTYFETLKAKQKRIFERFEGAKDFAKLKKALRKLRSTMKKMEKGLTEVSASMGTTEFEEMFAKIGSVTEVLKKLDFKADLEGVRQTVSELKRKSKEGKGWGLFWMVAFGFLVFAGCLCMFSVIKKAEES